MRIAGLALIASVVFAVSTPASAQGGCGGASINDFLKHPNVIAIFKGTATAVQNVKPSLSFPRDRREIATMAVNTVWKGEVPSQTTLYAFIGTGNVGMQVNSEYLVIAHVLSPESRAWFGLPWTGEPVIGSNQFGCGIKPMASASTMTAASMAKFIGDAPGYPPKP